MDIKSIIRVYLTTLVQNHRSITATILKKRMYVVYKYIIDNTEQIPCDREFTQRIDWIINNRTEYPKCYNEKCGKYLNLRKNFVRGKYKKYCCVKCASQSDETKKKIQRTKEIRYGDPYFRNPDKAKKTNLERYGKISYTGTDEYKKITKQTCLEKYGVEHSSKNDIIKKKSKETRFKRYGKYESENSTIKRKNTNIERFGVENVVYSNEWQNKMKNSIKQKYGVSNNFQRDDVKERIRIKMRQLYGCDNPSQSQEIMRKKSKKYYFDKIYFDSSWEVSYYIWLKDNNIHFQYHPDIKLEYLIDNTIHFYYPDFIVNGVIVEIKGDYMFDKNGNPYNIHTKKFWFEKYNCMISNNVKIMKYKDLKQFVCYTLKKYGKNFFKSIKNK